jgi:hypothetical protein
VKKEFIIILLFSAACASADQFQIVARADGNSFNVSYATVSITNPRFQGVTDGFGRLTIDLPPGQYTAHVRSRDRDG